MTLRMVDVPSSRVCMNCAEARRKCTKERPQCRRCQTRGRTCSYPPSKPSSFIILPVESTTISNAVTRSNFGMTRIPSPIELNLPVLDDRIASRWFASPETWVIDPPHAQLYLPPPFTLADYNRMLRKVVDWLIRWVETASNPFIHHQLWKKCFPAEIQNAYMALAAFLHKTSSNAEIISRIIEDRVTELVANGLILNAEPNMRDDVLNLGRVQALLVYQCIGLYDGDVRLRKLAERHLNILESWVNILMQHTSSMVTVATPPDNVPPGNSLWYSWIIAESVRRIWLVTAGMQGMYRYFAQSGGPQPPCLGGTIFTSRNGFWEAPSALAWEKQCSERFSGLVRLTETEKMLAMVPKEEISEFAKMVLECTYGSDWCEQRLGPSSQPSDHNGSVV
ncbi:hypothetical protein DE146DRAFT_306489 [Phaeosphaeria sp. MPI-PUGE-AT-0046c]|nr:hypothetical protein DE146DRAFT_306489 [Phaeosphaeria sp. MPI-PUGE-AT-0046c]